MKLQLLATAFLLAVGAQNMAQASTSCGLKGTIEQRIADCSSRPEAVRDDFVLVTRSKEGKEVRKDIATGLVWGPKVIGPILHAKAEKNCLTNGIKELAGVPNLERRLPSLAELKDAAAKDAGRKLQNGDGAVWSSEAQGNYANERVCYDLRFNRECATRFDSLHDVSFRCVSL